MKYEKCLMISQLINLLIHIYIFPIARFRGPCRPWGPRMKLGRNACDSTSTSRRLRLGGAHRTEHFLGCKKIERGAPVPIAALEGNNQNI